MSRARYLIPFLLASFVIGVVFGKRVISIDDIGFEDVYQQILPAGNPGIDQGRAVINYGGILNILDVDRFLDEHFFITFRLFYLDPQGLFLGFSQEGHQGYELTAGDKDFCPSGACTIVVQGQGDRYYVFVDGIIKALWSSPDRARGDFVIDGKKSDIRIDDLSIKAVNNDVSILTWKDDFERANATSKPFTLFVALVTLGFLVWYVIEVLIFARIFRFDRTKQAPSLLWSTLITAGLSEIGTVTPGFEWLVPVSAGIFFYLRFRFFLACSSVLDFEKSGANINLIVGLSFYLFAAFSLFNFAGQAFENNLILQLLFIVCLFIVFPLIVFRLVETNTLRRTFEVFGYSSLGLAWLGLMSFAFSGNEGAGRLVSIGLPLSLMIYFLPLRANRKIIRGYGILMLIMSVFVFFTIEIALRIHPESARFRPMNIGANFDQDDLLFWVPKGLFPQGEDFSLAADPSVRKVAFRSGDVPVEKDPDEFRIMVLGASNVWGDGIDDVSKTFSMVLDSITNEHLEKTKVRVINAGVPGYNSFQVRLFFEKFAAKYQPDLVIVYLGRNDATGIKGIYTFRELYEMASDPQMKIMRKAQRTLSKSAIYNGWTGSITKMRNAGRVSNFNDDLLKVPVPPNDFQENLAAIARKAKSIGAKTILVSEFWGEPSLYLKDFDAKAFYAYMQKAAEQEGALYYNAYFDLLENYELFDIIFRDNVVHLNEHGHSELAKRLYDVLVQNKLLPAK